MFRRGAAGRHPIPIRRARAPLVGSHRGCARRRLPRRRARLRTMRVLMSAYACEPLQGSEPAVGWHWALEATHAGHEVWVVTRTNNRAAIESALDPGVYPNLHFEYIDLPRPFQWLKHRLGHIGLLAYYYAWQILLAAHTRHLHRRSRFDLAHHVTFVNDTLPSGLAVLNIPFVWGPIGGNSRRLPATDRDRTHAAGGVPRECARHAAVLLEVRRPFHAAPRARSTLILAYTREALAGLRPSERRHSTCDRSHWCDRERPFPRGERPVTPREWGPHPDGRSAHTLEGLRPADRRLHALPPRPIRYRVTSRDHR